MKKFTEIDIKQKTYVDNLKENIYSIINENVKIQTDNEEELSFDTVIHESIVNKMHRLIVKERINERLNFLRDFRNNVYVNGLDMKKISEYMDKLEEAYSAFEDALEKYETEIREILSEEYGMSDGAASDLIDFYYTKVVDNYSNGIPAKQTVREIKNK